MGLPHRPCDPEQIQKADQAMDFMMKWIAPITEDRRLWEAYVSIFK